MPESDWTQQIKFRDYAYWEKKDQFSLDVDTYPCWTLFAIEEGKFSFEIEDFKGNASFGDLVVCPPGTPFHRKMIEPLTFHFYFFDGAASFPVGRITLLNHERLVSNYKYLKQTRTSHTYTSLSPMKHVLEDLWFMYGMQKSRQVNPNKINPSGDELIRKVTLWIESHAFQPLSFKEMASFYKLTQVQLIRRFQQYHKMPPHVYLTNLRMKKAQTLLLETNDTLEQIAKQCGYENGFYLSRVFTKKMKMSPSKYRKTYHV